MAQSPAKAILQRLRARVSEETLAGLTDAQLLQRFAHHGEQAAFETLVRRHGSAVLRVCRTILHDEHATEDAFQATFLVLVKKAATLRRQELLGPWLRGVASRVAARARVDAARRLNREAHAQARPAPDPVADAGTRELCALLEEEVERLPGRCREAFRLCYLEGLTRDQAAQRLGWSVRTLQRLLEQGRAILQARLSQRGVTLSAALLAATLAQGVTPASVPAALQEATTAAALIQASGLAAAGAVSPAATLAQTVLCTMALARIKLAALLLALGVLAAGVGLLATSAQPPEPAEAGQQKATPPSDKARPRAEAGQQAAMDLLGDPLPRGAVLRLGTLRLRHGSPVLFLAFSPDGKTLASGGWIKTARLWDVETGKEPRAFDLPQKPGAERANVVNCLTFAPDGKALATGSIDGPIYLWETATGQRLRTLEGHKGSVGSLAFTPDGKTLISMLAHSRDGKGGEIILWDTATWKERRRLREAKGEFTGTLALSPDGKTLATAAANSPSVTLWDVETGERLRSLARRKDEGGVAWPIDRLAFSPDGKTLIGGGGRSADLWDVARGTWLRELAGRGDVWGRVPTFAPDGKLIASAGNYSPVFLWDATTGKELHKIEGRYGGVQALAFTSRGGRTVLAAGTATGTIALWEIPSAEALRARTRSPRALHPLGHDGAIYSVAVAPDGKTVATGSIDCTVFLWDAATGKQLGRLEGDQHSVTDACFSPDGKWLATGSNYHGALVWDLATGKIVHRLAGRCVAFSPDGKLLATGGREQRGVVRLYDSATGKELRQLHGYQAGIYRVAFAPDGRTLVSGGRGVLGGTRAVDEEVETTPLRLWDVASGKQLFEFGDLRHYGYALGFSPDGKTVASVGGDELNKATEVFLWEAATGRGRGSLATHRERLWSVAFAPDGRTLATASGEGSVSLWDLADPHAWGKELRRLEGHRKWTLALAFLPRGERLISGGWDSTGLVWDVSRLRGKGGPGRRLSGSELDALWRDLGAADALAAYRAIRTLAAAPTQAVPFLGARLKPVAAVSPDRLARLITDLGSAVFARRQEATAELERLGPLAVPALREALAAKPELEMRRHLERLALHSAPLSGEALRAWRALEALEHAGTTEARQVLERLARGAPGARLTEEARAAGRRLAERAAGSRNPMPGEP
ncbi:MAG: sigma-70 family RNA polymerase sigma factor [Gemmataceae bacterium]|nr:sigma-70 family RNA polymerase sigma factor [Gemmataceae bacterium]